MRGCQHKNQLSFCYIEHSEEARKHKLMYTKFFDVLRMKLFFDSRFLF